MCNFPYSQQSETSVGGNGPELLINLGAADVSG